LPGDVAAQHVVQFALELVDRKGDLRSREEDPGQSPASGHEDWRSGTQQARGLVSEFPNRADPHVATLVTIV
jgi:hypothetical protein